MKILAVDVGTGTQDILLFDPRLDVENAFKLVVPSPTMIVRERIRQATRQRQPVLLHGVMMGGGPCAWAVEDHLKQGLPVYATPAAALTLNDDLAVVKGLGIILVGDDEVESASPRALRVHMRDFDIDAIRGALALYGIGLDDLAAVGVAVFDHGAAPPNLSDRQFRFDYLDERIRSDNRLSAFAYRSEDVPAIMTRLQAVAHSASSLDAPLVVMDTAPAAVLGATFDARVQALERVVIANVGNFHTLAFRMGPVGIEGVFEHHTGLIDRARLEGLLRALAEGTLTHAEVFDSMGHGALVYDHAPFDLDGAGLRLVATGPRRSMLLESALRPYFAVPFGDMMLTGCFGLLAATADCLPALREPIWAALRNGAGRGTPPWEVS